MIQGHELWFLDIFTMINRIVNRKLTVSIFRQSIPLTSNPGPIETLIATKLTSEFDPRKVSKDFDHLYKIF